MAAVTTHWFTKGGKNILEAEIGWVASPIFVALMQAGFVFDQDTPESFSEIQASEAVGAGYIASGKQVANKSVVVDAASNEARLLGDPVEWPNSTINAQGAVIFNNSILTGGMTAYALLGYCDFGAARASANGLFRIEWPATGVLRTRAL